ncbi:MAG TPA: hypothetical protein VLF21_03555 [Candidatus Saccharimonadales bacterium]|nr:hypothetical protein [Candidatus Saccharimonadales bacterium]
MNFKKLLGLERPRPHELAYVLGIPKVKVDLETIKPFTSFYIAGVVDGVYCRLILEVERIPKAFRVLRSNHPCLLSGSQGFFVGACEDNRVVEYSLRDDMAQMLFAYAFPLDQDGKHFLVERIDDLRVLRPRAAHYLGSDDFAGLEFWVSPMITLERLDYNIEDALAARRPGINGRYMTSRPKEPVV